MSPKVHKWTSRVDEILKGFRASCSLFTSSTGIYIFILLTSPTGIYILSHWLSVTSLKLSASSRNSPSSLSAKLSKVVGSLFIFMAMLANSSRVLVPEKLFLEEGPMEGF